MSFLQIALLLLGLDLRFDYVGVGDFAAMLQFLADVKKSRASASAFCAVEYFRSATTDP